MKEQAVEFAYRHCPQCLTENPQAGDIPFRCQQCGFVHFFGPVAAVGGLVVNEHNELLLVRRARNPGKGLWGLPGGFVDRDETIEQALAREVLEETELRLTHCQYLMSYPNEYKYDGIVSPVIDLFFLCRVENASELCLAPEELDHHRWTRPTPSDLDKMAFHSNRLAIEHWLHTVSAPSG